MSPCVSVGRPGVLLADWVGGSSAEGEQLGAVVTGVRGEGSLLRVGRWQEVDRY